MELREDFHEIPIGQGRKIADGSDVAFVTYGAIGNYIPSVRARLENLAISAAHYDLRFVKPLDSDLLTEVFESFDRVITLEDGVIDGGAGSAVIEWMTDHRYSADVLRLGLPDEFIEHGTQRELHDLVGIGPDGIFDRTIAFIGHESLISTG